MDERDTIRRIRQEVAAGKILHTFKPSDVSEGCGFTGPESKHREGNPGGETELFVRVGRGVYRLK